MDLKGGKLMDIAKAFSFVFEDEAWVSKVLLGGLLFFIPIVNFAVFGYMLKVAQNVAQGNPRPLPEWGEFGDHFMRGLYWFAIQIVYQLPTIILYILFFCVIAAAGGPADSQRGGNGAGAIGALGFCLLPLIFVLALVGAFLAYVAAGRYVATNNLSEAFKFGQVIAAARGNLGAWLMVLLVVILAGFVGGLGVIACGVGVLFTSFYAQCVIGHALGQTVAQLGMLGDATQPPAPPPMYQ
jgi:Protein of unknown function (DUF4013)